MVNSIATSPIGMRAAIVGLGRMGLRHLEALQKLGMTVCAVCDRSKDAVEAAARQFSIEAKSCYVDALEMIAAERPQALVIATTAPAHAELTIAAARHGVERILCEKPMANSIGECEDMISACKEAGTQLAVNHQMRFMPRFSDTKALLDGDEFGPLSSMIVASSNFGLAMNASHYFEAFRYMSGNRATRLQAWFDDAQVANPRGPEFQDRAGRLLARDDAGRSMFIDFSAKAGHGLQSVYICRNGQVSVDELSGDVRVTVRKAEHRDLPTTRYGMPADLRSFNVAPPDTVVSTMRVWETMLAGGDFPDGGIGLYTVTCLVAAHLSNEGGGKEIRLDAGELPRDRKFPWA